jgi:hypothetical protein
MSTLHVTNSIRAFRSYYYDKILKKNVSLTPDQLFEAYVSLVPMLPNNISSWGLTLAHQYHSALSEDVKQRLARDKSYFLPDPAMLPTKITQLSALRTLRRAASVAQRELHDETRITTRLIQTSLLRNPRTNILDTVLQPPPPLPLLAPLPPFPPTTPRPSALVSPAEETMRRYQPNPGSVFSTDPATGYVSRHPNNFTGCLGCGNANHVFKQCPARNDPTTKQTFFRELFCIKPHLRRRPADAAELEIVRQQQQQSTPARIAQATAPIALPPTTAPATQGVQFTLPTVPESPIEVATDDANNPGLFTVTVPILQERSASRPPMPVAIDNGLPHIDIRIGDQQDPSSNHHFACLLDTCAALNTGYNKYHFWLASVYPHCVAELIHCDDPENPFEAARLLGAVADSTTVDLSTHGRLTSVIRYFTPYTIGNTKQPVIISFGLGPDVSVNSILGLPSIDSFNLNINLGTNRAYSSICDITFDITRARISHGLAPSISFDLDHFQRTNPSTDNPANPCPRSRDISVQDTFNHGYLNRTISYLPPHSSSDNADPSPL